LAVICLITTLSFARNQLNKDYLKKKLETITFEEKKFEEMIEKLKKEYFVERKIGSETYQKTLKNYEVGLSDARRRKVETFSKLLKMLKKDEARKRLEEEERRLKEEIANLQRQYFEHGKFGKPLYERMFKDLKWELIEIEKLREVIEGEKGG